MFQHYLRNSRHIKIVKRWKRKPPVNIDIQPMTFSSLLFLAASALDIFSLFKKTDDPKTFYAMLELYTNGALKYEELIKLPDDVVSQIWQAVCDINDWDYIRKMLGQPNKEQSSNWGATFATITKFFPAYKIEDILQMPAQMVFQIVEDIEAMYQDEETEYRDFTPSDWERLRKKYA